MVFPEYAELHCHSHFSFKEGSSSVDQLIATAKNLGYTGIALTDHDNLTGAMQFAQASQAIGLRGIIGVEFTLIGGYHLTALAETFEGYSNLCKLLSLSHVFAGKRNKPELDPRFLKDHSRGIIAMSGCRIGEIPYLIELGEYEKAKAKAKWYMELFSPENFYVELQQNLVRGDTSRNNKLRKLAEELKLEVVATNNVHYHIREYAQLHDCLVSIALNKPLDATHIQRRANSEYFLKTPQDMSNLFKDCPEAILNTTRIANRCIFDLTNDLNYRFPLYSPPNGYTPESYLEALCHAAAIRRYGEITPEVRARLDEEFRLIKKHNLSGFLLYYHDIAQLARKVMIKLGLSEPEIPLEEKPPGRGRGSSVALLVGYLIGLSHIDPIQYKLSLERFLPEDLLDVALDIDLDFPRNIREELILAVHEEWGWEHAALTGMVNTYKIRGAIRDLGKVLALPSDQIDILARRVSHTNARNIEKELVGLPEFVKKTNHPGWRDLIRLAPQLDGVPRYVSQHPGGMIVSSLPLTEIVPIQRGAIDGRYIVQWDKNDINAANMVKIDFLALGALSQLQDILQMVERRTGYSIDISRIPHEDSKVYDMLALGDTVGIFQIESAAQMQTITRIKPRNLQDMAYEVACVRPGVGLHDGVRHFIDRRLGRESITYDHPLEHRALERTLGVILYQDQINQLATDVGGFSSFEADQMRRAFGRRNSEKLLDSYEEKFLSGAQLKGVDAAAAKKIFNKFSGHYMFPEAHAVAFGVTSYQLSWLKYYYPLEFMVSLFNQQPMGFWGLETLKEDAKRHGIRIFNPDVNISGEECTIEGHSIRLGIRSVHLIGKLAGENVIRERERGGIYISLGDFMTRTGCQREAIENLIRSGAFDSLCDDRRSLLWETGLRYRPHSKQLALDLPVEQDMTLLPRLAAWEQMLEEYNTLGIYPSGHFMEMLRPHLASNVLTSNQIKSKGDNQRVKTAGIVARPLQHPLSKAYFITLEDEFGFIPLVIWPGIYEEYKDKFREPFIFIDGIVSRKEGTFNLVVTKATTLHNYFGKYSPSEILKLPRPMFR